YVGMALESEWLSTRSEIDCRKHRTWIGSGISIRTTEGGDESGIDNSHPVVLIQERVLVRRSDLYVVNALGVIQIETQPCIGEVSVLPDGERLNWTEVSQWIRAGVVIELIATYECP